MDEERVTLDEFKSWRVPALKEFCRKRNLKVSGNKEELVARVFSATEMKIPVQPTNEQLIKRTANEKKQLLVAPDNITEFPDPATLKEGWLGEDKGLTLWPPIFLSDITDFVMKNHPGKEVGLQERVLNEYKEGKAYRLYESGFLKEIIYHEISKESEYCCLKANCTHSQSVTDVPHDVWIFAKKKTGDISRAYCSCTSGIGSTCGHVMAILFRIEAANKSGLTNPACTSKLCEWNVPGKGTDLTPKRICEMEFKAAKLNKESSRPPVDITRTLFNPSISHRLVDTEKRDVLFSHLRDTLPQSCFCVLKSAEQDDFENVQPSLKKCKLTEKEINEIEQNTVGQSENMEWHSQRKGRITASNFHRVLTRSETLQSTGGDPTALINSLMGISGPSGDVYSLKYGRNMEPIAKAKYLKLFSQMHKDVKHRECGIFICEDKQYLGASPDLLVECSCCGKGVLEIKCPYSIINEKPSHTNLPYLVLDDGNIVLKKRHNYYAQVQGQMAITKRNWCHFMVYTQSGVHLETITFDQGYWKNLKDNLEWFYENHLAAALSV